MATDMIDNNKTDELDLNTPEVFTTTTTSTLAETTIYDDIGKNVQQILPDNVTTSYNFNATNFTSTTLTQILNKTVTSEVFEGSTSSTFHLGNVTFVQETISSQLIPSTSSSTSLPVIPLEASTAVEDVLTLSPDSFNTTISSFEETSGYLSEQMCHISLVFSYWE